MLKSLIAAVVSAVIFFSNAPVRGPQYQGRLAALGDSITYGYGLSDRGDCHAALLAGMLNLELDNMAVNGYRASDVFLQIRLDQNWQKLSRASVICLSAGGNELLSPLTETLYEIMRQKGISGDISELTPEQFFPIVYQFITDTSLRAALDARIEESLNKFETDFKLLIAQIKVINPDAPLVVQTLYNPLDGSGNPLLQPIAERYAYAFDRINAVIRNTKGVKIADVATAFAGRAGELTNINRYDVHPNAEGHKLIARLEYEALKYKDYRLPDIVAAGAAAAIFSVLGSMIAVR